MRRLLILLGVLLIVAGVRSSILGPLVGAALLITAFSLPRRKTER